MFKNKAVLVFGIVLVLVVAAIFGIKYFKPSPPSNVTVPADSVVIQSNSFTPEALSVKVGQKVTWTNNDSYAHTVTSDDGTFDSGNLGPGQSFGFTFSKAGTYAYHCAVHTFMNAKVVVTN